MAPTFSSTTILFIIYFMEMQLIYNVVLISVIQQSDSVISYIYIMEKNMKKNIYVYIKEYICI